MKEQKETAIATASPASLDLEFGQVFLKRDPHTGNWLRPIKADVALYERAGHIYRIPGTQEKWAITSDGYARLNKVAGISIQTPPHVVVDGQTRPNPFIERDPATGMIAAVHIRKIGIGYGPLGQVVVIDKTLYYHIYSYFIQSLQSKAKRAEKENSSNPLALIGLKSDKPNLPGKWAFFPTMRDLGVWANYEHPDIQAVIADDLQRQRFGDRIAQRILERNILKTHPAIGVSSGYLKADKERGTYMIVQVFGYRTDESPQELYLKANQVYGGQVTDLEPEEEAAECRAEVAEVKAESEAEESGLLFKPNGEK